jgi:hypothetical protein
MQSLESPVFQEALQRARRSHARRANQPHLDTAEFRSALTRCLNTVAQGVTAGHGDRDVEGTRRALADLAGLVHSEGSVAATRDYDSFLRTLTRLYADGCEQRANRACTNTAAGYAAVIGAISRRHPGFDYTDTLGQLLELMTRLFQARDNDWRIVYKHLRSVPDSISAKQTLTRVCSADIREWFDAGVQNLFSLRSDLAAKLRELEEHVRDIDDEIGEKGELLAELHRRLDPEGQRKVVILQGRSLEREIASLEIEKQDVLDEVAGRESTLALIESDIAEFESILREARRAYYLHVV